MQGYQQAYYARCYSRVKVSGRDGLIFSYGITIDAHRKSVNKVFMKKLMIILLIVAGGFTRSDAQSMLNVRLADNTPVNIAVDGRYFNKRGTSVTVGDLPPGKHFVQIYSVTRNRRGRGAEDVIYEGKVKTYEGMVTILGYDPYSREANQQQQDINTFAANHPPVQNGIGANGNAGNPNNGNYGNNYDQSNGNNNSGNNMPAAAPVTGTLTDAKIDNLKTEVAAKHTDTEKENILKQELKDEKLTADQVSMMMDWLEFESSKEDFAEWAWNNTVNKDAYINLEAKFTYKTYQDALDKFIKAHP